MIVVSDTSPIRALGNLGLLTLLQRLFGRVVVPRAVALELGQAPTGPFVIGLDDLAGFTGVEIADVADDALVGRFLGELDRGESEALALAVELRADLILIDESAGRSAARRIACRRRARRLAGSQTPRAGRGRRALARRASELASILHRTAAPEADP